MPLKTAIYYDLTRNGPPTDGETGFAVIAIAFVIVASLYGFVWWLAGRVHR